MNCLPTKELCARYLHPLAHGMATPIPGLERHVNGCQRCRTVLRRALVQRAIDIADRMEVAGSRKVQDAVEYEASKVVDALLWAQALDTDPQPPSGAA